MAISLTQNLVFNEGQRGAARPSRDWLTITRKIREGNTEAFAICYENFFDLVYLEVHRATGSDEATCLDLVQETFLKIIRCVKPIESEAQMAAWTRAVARSTSYDWLRAQSRRNQLHRRYGAQQNDEDQTGKKDRLETAERLVWLQAQIEELSPDLRRMVALRYRLGWSLARIAKSFGLTTGAVDGRLRRAIEKIRKQTGRTNDD